MKFLANKSYIKIQRNKRTLALTSVLFAITKFPYISDVLIATIIHQHYPQCAQPHLFYQLTTSHP